MNSDIHFDCPFCSQRLCIEERGAGVMVDCPTCNKQIPIPISSAAKLAEQEITPPSTSRRRQLGLVFIVLGLCIAAYFLLWFDTSVEVESLAQMTARHHREQEAI